MESSLCKELGESEVCVGCQATTHLPSEDELKKYLNRVEGLEQTLVCVCVCAWFCVYWVGEVCVCGRGGVVHMLLEWRYVYWEVNLCVCAWGGGLGG